MLTKERVEELLSYDAITGLFIWRSQTSRGHRELSGKIAGCIAPNGYVMLGIDRKLYRAHRVVFLLELGMFPINKVDHINGNKKDNRRENLRIVTKQQNAWNSNPHSDSKTSVKNVYWDSSRNKFKVQMYINGKHKLFGRYETIEEASNVAKLERIKYHGVYARHD